MSDHQDSRNQGRIPFRLRVGVTGHRRLTDEEALANQARRALHRIRELVPSSPHTPVLFTVISPLAEGADRLVAREVLEDEDADLEVPLPLPQQEYLRDFETEASKSEFQGLLSRAELVTQLPPSRSSEEAYESVGRYVVDCCDVLIALWDGKPSCGQGATATIVHYARDRGVPLIWINTEGSHESVEMLGNGINAGPFRQLDEYNRAKIAQEHFAQQVDQHRSQLLDVARQRDTRAPPLQVISEWVSAFYVRADLLAMRYQNWYYVLGNALFLLAAAAVAAVASQVAFAPETPELVLIEVGLMVGVLLIVVIGRLWHFHDRWISYRFLAERFRSAFFLALAGLGGYREASLEQVYLGHPSEEWLRRAFGEVWSQRPQVDLADSSVEDVRRFLVEAWIEDQSRFHRSAQRKYKARHLRLSLATTILFGATLAAAALHASGLAEHESAGPLSWADLLVVLAISMPALGAAVSGIRAEREYLGNSERYDQMARHLEGARERMLGARDIETVGIVAAEAENLMLEENRDWFIVMRPHEVRPPW